VRTENKHRSEAVAKYYELELILNVNRLEMIYHATSTCTRPWQVGKKLGSRFVEVGHELSVIFSNAKVTPLESEFHRHDEEWPDADISHLKEYSQSNKIPHGRCSGSVLWQFRLKDTIPSIQVSADKFSLPSQTH